VDDQGAGALLEREQELDAIERLVGLAANGRGALVIVEGPAGIGRTRLLAAAHEVALQAGLVAVTARGAVLDAGRSYATARTLLRPILDDGIASGQASKAVAGAAAFLFDRAAASAEPRPAQANAVVVEALCEMVLAAAERQPLFLSVDDAHWVDGETLTFLTVLADRVEQAPLLLAIAARLNEPGSASELRGLLASRAAIALRPAGFSPQAVSVLLARELGVDPAPAFVAACATAAGGNPFLCAELARTLADDGIAPTDDNVARVSAFAPPGVCRAVLARLARIDPGAVRVAAALAVLGGQADWNVLAGMTEIDHDQLADAVDVLIGAGVAADSPGPEFRHPMIRTVIYEDLALSERDRAHRRAARLLSALPAADSQRVAAHLLLTRPRADGWVAEQLAAAGDVALSEGAAEAACRYLKRALAEPPEPALTPHVLERLGEAESRRGDPVAAASALRAALERANDPVARGEVAIALSTVLTRADRAPEAIAVLEAEIRALPSAQIELGRRMETEMEVIAHVDGHAGRRMGKRVPKFPRPPVAAPDDQGHRLALAGRADVEMNRGRADEAARLALLALDDGALMRAEGAGMVLFFSTAIVLLYCDRLDDAQRMYTEAVGDAGRRGQPGAAASAQGFLAGMHLRRGQLAEAEHHARAALEGLGAVDAPNSPVRTTFAVAFLVDALIELGRLGEAARLLSETGADGALPDALITNVLQHARGRWRAASGDHRNALADHLDCGRRAREWGMQTPAVANWRSLAALELATLGDVDEARAHAAAGADAARAFGSPRAIGMALTVQGRLESSVTLLEEATNALRDTGARLDLARAQYELGAAQRRHRQRARARETLTASLRLARACGALPLAKLIDEELAVSGSRSRRVLRSGGDALTASERRTAALAADGYTNQQIADALVVSVRTVETHLAHVYQKLDVTSRRQLPAALGRVATRGG
jgi:DNA-binding CsgD family transcriptional regulator